RVDAVVAVDDRLQRRTGPQRAGDAADTGPDLRIADRNAHLVGQIPTDLRGQVADRVDLASRGRIQATLQTAQNAAIRPGGPVDHFGDDDLELLAIQQRRRHLGLVD